MEAEQLVHLRAERGGVEPSARERLSEIWDEAAPQLAHLARALGIDANRAEDVLQDVYLSAWERMPAQLDRDHLRAWLFKVTANRCKLEHRRQNRWREVLSGLGRWWTATPHAPPAADMAARAEERQLIRDALERLPAPWRSLLVLRYLSGFNSKQIGTIMELPDSTVRSHLRAARKELARELKQAGFTDDE